VSEGSPIDEPRCHDCDWTGSDDSPLYLVAADFGEGAFLNVLCRICEHRRWYRAELKRRKRGRSSKSATNSEQFFDLRSETGQRLSPPHATSKETDSP
jgi:hypothetical protein